MEHNKNNDAKIIVNLTEKNEKNNESSSIAIKLRRMKRRLLLEHVTGSSSVYSRQDSTGSISDFSRSDAGDEVSVDWSC